MPLVKPDLPPRPSPSAKQQKGQPPVLVPCPRSKFETGHTDWYNITSPKAFQGVDICTTCYDGTFRNTPYAGCLTRSPSKPKDIVTRCDHSDTWNRAATYWLFVQSAPDLSLLGTVAALPPDEDGYCPNINMQYPEPKQEDSPTATRTWYCLSDATTGTLIEDLTVCSACVGRVNVMFPSLRGIFRSVANGQKVQATCDLLTAKKSGNRGECYLEKMIEAAQQHLKTGHLDTRPLTDFVKKWAPIPVCMGAEPNLSGTRAWTFPKSIPHYAVCDECYTFHVLPLLESDNPPTILKELSPTTYPSGYVCDLYSPRLLQYFKDAVASYNLEAYKQRYPPRHCRSSEPIVAAKLTDGDRLMAREAKSKEYKLKIDQLRLQHRQYEQQARIFGMQQRTAETQERIRAMQWNSSAYYAPPVCGDFSSRFTFLLGSIHSYLFALLCGEGTPADERV